MNWRETALDHSKIPLDPDFSIYAKADKAGTLHVTAARNDEGELVGYFVLFCVPHPHYRSTIFAMMDAYFLRPEYRKGAAGLRMFSETEKLLKGRGVVEIIANTKVHHDMSKLFARLKWRLTAYTFTKVIG